jgi:hypothetical protein
MGSNAATPTDAFIFRRLARVKDIFRYFAEYFFGCEQSRISAAFGQFPHWPINRVPPMFQLREWSATKRQSTRCSAVLFRTHLINRNGCVARDLALLQGARRENILYGSLNDEQRRSRAKGRATLRAEFWRAAGGVAPQSQSAAAMLFPRALPAIRQNSAHPSLFMRWVLVITLKASLAASSD